MSTPPALTAGTRAVTLRFLAAPTDVNAIGTVSAGRVLEWIDKAGYACAVAWSQRYCVTAYIGDVKMAMPIPPGALVEIEARIVLTGRTSMHVQVAVSFSRLADRGRSEVCECLTVFVALEQGVPSAVPSFEPNTAEDLRVAEVVRSRLSQRSLIQSLVQAHDFGLPGSSPRQKFIFLAAPNDQNWGGNAHGGIIIRWMIECGFACVAGWTRQTPLVVYLGGIQFSNPIPIGHLVQVEADVLRSTPRSLHVSVRAWSSDPRRPGESRLAVQGFAVFVATNDVGAVVPVPQLPLSNSVDKKRDKLARDLQDIRDAMSAI